MSRRDINRVSRNTFPTASCFHHCLTRQVQNRQVNACVGESRPPEKSSFAVRSHQQPIRSRAILEAALVHDVISCPSNFLRSLLQLSNDEHGKQFSQQAQKCWALSDNTSKAQLSQGQWKGDRAPCLATSRTVFGNRMRDNKFALADT